MGAAVGVELWVELMEQEPRTLKKPLNSSCRLLGARPGASSIVSASRKSRYAQVIERRSGAGRMRMFKANVRDTRGSVAKQNCQAASLRSVATDIERGPFPHRSPPDEVKPLLRSPRAAS